MAFLPVPALSVRRPSGPASSRRVCAVQHPAPPPAHLASPAPAVSPTEQQTESQMPSTPRLTFAALPTSARSPSESQPRFASPSVLPSLPRALPSLPPLYFPPHPSVSSLANRLLPASMLGALLGMERRARSRGLSVRSGACASALSAAAAACAGPAPALMCVALCAARQRRDAVGAVSAGAAGVACGAGMPFAAAACYLIAGAVLRGKEIGRLDEAEREGRARTVRRRFRPRLVGGSGRVSMMLRSRKPVRVTSREVDESTLWFASDAVSASTDV
jgi:hypothetical protein